MIITSASDRTLKHEFYGKLAISPPMFKNFLGHLRTHYPAEFPLIQESSLCYVASKTGCYSFEESTCFCNE